MLHIMLLAFNVTYVSKKLHSKNNLKEVKNKMEIAKERFISPEIYIQKEDSKLVITKINIIIS